MESNNKIPNWDKMEKIEVNPNEEAERLSDLFIGNVKEQFEKNKITAMNPKQKAIKDHYIKAFIDSGMSEEEAEESFEAIEAEIDDWGWLNEDNITDKGFEVLKHILDFIEPTKDLVYSRPKSLDGLESNRGWNKIEDGLPEEGYETEYFIVDTDGNIYTGVLYVGIYCWVKGDFFYNPTHWQPITKPNLPLY